MRKGISLVGFRSADEVREASERFPDAWFELSYAMDSAFLEEVRPYVEGRVASVHSLCPRRAFFPNFAADEDDAVAWSMKEMMADAETARRFGASVLVLHPGYLVPSLVPTDSRKRIALMGCGILDPYIAISHGSICRTGYISSPEYRRAFERMIPRLEHLSGKLEEEGLTLAVENLNPRAGYMLIHPDEMVELAEHTHLHLTLDIGHLWITSELFSLDFLSSVKRILSTGRVVTTHLHSNPSDRAECVYEDSHQSLDRFSMPYREALDAIARSGANMMLETKEEAMHNLSLLFSQSSSI